MKPISEMSDREIIDEYFRDPEVKRLMHRDLGPSGKVEVDWENNVIRAKGTKLIKTWELDKFVENVRAIEESYENETF